MNEYVLGIDLGGTNIKIGCFDTNLKLIGKVAVPTRADMEPELIVDKFKTVSEELLKQKGLSLANVRAIGIGSPGPVNLAEGIVLAAPNLPLFRNVPLKKMVSQRLGKPTIMENDANAACWAEHVIGVGKGADYMVLLTLGTGIGGGIISNGQLVHGPSGGAAELGHIIIYPDGRICACGQKGCVEAYASANSTTNRATEAIQEGRQSTLTKTLEKNGEITSKDVFEHATNGDALAKEIVEGTTKALALVCVQLAYIIEPKQIVFAGGMIAAGDSLLNQTRQFFKQYISESSKKESIEICFATLGEDAGIIGTSALALAACH